MTPLSMCMVFSVKNHENKIILNPREVSHLPVIGLKWFSKHIKKDFQGQGEHLMTIKSKIGKQGITNFYKILKKITLFNGIAIKIKIKK